MPSRHTRYRVFQLTTFMALAAALSSIVLAFTFPLSLFFVSIAIVVTVLCVWQPMIGVYGMALTYPYLNMELAFGGLNVPIVDVFGLCSVLALSIRLIHAYFVRNRLIPLVRTPGIIPWAIFIIIAFLATPRAFVFLDSVKYVTRPLIFFFIVFVITVPGIIRSQKALRTTLVCMMITALVVALYGIIGFVVVDTPSLLERRVVPFSLFGYFPLGYNHNLIADVMVTSLPLAWYLWSSTRDVLSKRIYLVIMLILIFTGLLTFSRTAWLALIVEGVVLGLYMYRSVIRQFLPLLATLILAALPLGMYMVIFMQQDEVQSSNENRIMLGEIALDMWSSFPLIGAGPGTFMSYVERNPIYMKEFGAPLDAHSVTYKVLAENGALGFIAFSLMSIAILRVIYRAMRKKEYSPQDRFFLICVFTMCIGGFFFQLFQTSYFVSKLWFPIGVALAAVYTTDGVYKKNTSI